MNYLKRYINMYFKEYMIVLIFLTVEALCDLMQPTIMSKIIDNGVALKDMNYIYSMGGKMLLITFIGAIAAVVRNILSSIVSQDFGCQIRGDLFKKTQYLSFDNINNFQEASLMNRLTNDVNQVQRFVNGMMRMMIKAPILGIGSIIMAILMNPSISMVLIGVIPIVITLIIINIKVSYPFFIKIQESLDNVNRVMREYLMGVRVIKSFNRFDYEVEHFENSNDELANISIEGMRKMAIFRPLISLTVNIGIVLIMWLGGVKVNKGGMKVGQIIAFINYMTQILFSLIIISRVFSMFTKAKASAERIEEVFNEENDLETKEYPEKINDITGKVDFEYVYFYYKGSKQYALEDISISFKPGETTAIIGSTGSGKSSLINLIPRFYDVSEGSIKIDDVDIRNINIKELRESISIVPQKTILFTGTIFENIVCGQDDINIDEVEKVAKIAQAHDFISCFPKSYDTILGQGGINLSGGQQQRISIARALVRKPKILILDDCTSAVDMISESKIRKGLKENFKDTTCIIIAQHINAIKEADNIVVLDNGAVMGVGMHENLLNECKVYQDIVFSQVGNEGI